ncbi:MAG: hypothetical protein KJO40_13630 [Deltaproteobacteria bacterium]|nr:hypothetical protein [Deltaproteobacteria bacterium]
MNDRTHDMDIWIVPYTRIPTNYHDTHRAKVEAEDADAARELVRDALGDNGPGLCNYVINKPERYCPPKSAGRIVSLRSVE